MGIYVYFYWEEFLCFNGSSVCIRCGVKLWVGFRLGFVGLLSEVINVYIRKLSVKWVVLRLFWKNGVFVIFKVLKNKMNELKNLLMKLLNLELILLIVENVFNIWFIFFVWL